VRTSTPTRQNNVVSKEKVKGSTTLFGLMAL
jgi:hypothetical protein